MPGDGIPLCTNKRDSWSKDFSRKTQTVCNGGPDAFLLFSDSTGHLPHFRASDVYFTQWGPDLSHATIYFILPLWMNWTWFWDQLIQKALLKLEWRSGSCFLSASSVSFPSLNSPGMLTSEEAQLVFSELPLLKSPVVLIFLCYQKTGWKESTMELAEKLATLPSVAASVFASKEVKWRWLYRSGCGLPSRVFAVRM